MGLDMSQVEALAGRLKATAGELGKDTTKALVKSAEAVKRGAKSRAPEGPTGDLRDEIYAATRGGRVAQIISPTRYAQFVEYGTYKDTPQPYMTPALEAEEPKFESAVEEAGLKVMRRAVDG